MSAEESCHPDAAWLNGVTMAVQAWLARDDGSAPTSQITGQGAVRAVEGLLSHLHGGRPALLVPSATYGLRLALQVCGVGPGDEVMVPGFDWPATAAAVRSLGAVPRPVDVDRRTLTISPTAAGQARTPMTRAVVACHLHGVPADVPALICAVPDLPVIEDCAQALGSTLDGQSAGTLGTAAVFSFGPGKLLDAGEAGMVLVTNDKLHRQLLQLGSHPVRQLLGGVLEPQLDFSVRPHPLAAVLLWYQLQRWDAAGARRQHELAAAQLRRWAGGVVLADARRRLATSAVPVRPHSGSPCPPGWSWRETSAQALSSTPAARVHLLTPTFTPEVVSIAEGWLPDVPAQDLAVAVPGPQVEVGELGTRSTEDWAG